MPEPEPKLEACGMCMCWVCDVCPSLNACVIERIVRATSFYVFGRVDAWIAGLLTQDFRKQLRSLGTIGLLLRDAVRFYFIAMALALVLHPGHTARLLRHQSRSRRHWAADEYEPPGRFLVWQCPISVSSDHVSTLFADFFWRVVEFLGFTERVLLRRSVMHKTGRSE